MKNLTKLALASLSLLGMATAAAPAAYAQAAAAAPDYTVSATVDVQSDYRFRGISQSHKNPVPQGALNITGPDGFYVGAWASQVDFDPTSSGNPFV